jgi:glycosyltransferase involved in cell wall biosynthesis
MDSKVSICIPTYNGAEYLEALFESIAIQTTAPLEVIISDDNSKDETLSIARVFASEAPYPVHIHHHEPKGIGANWNNSIRLAEGEYVKLLFQDDLMSPSCLAQMSTHLDNCGQCAAVAARRHIIDEHGHHIESNDWVARYGELQSKLIWDAQEPLQLDRRHLNRKDFLKDPVNFIGEPTAVMFRKKIWEEIGPFSETLRQALDIEYWMRILRHHRVDILPGKLVSFRLHQKQATRQNEAHAREEGRQWLSILRHNYHDVLHAAVLDDITVRLGETPLPTPGFWQRLSARWSRMSS